MPTALRASRRCVSAVVIIVIVVVAAAIAAVIGTAVASFFAPLRGDLEELVGVSSCRRVVTGGRADLFGGVGSFPGEGIIFAALQFLMEQELEVFSPSVVGSSSSEAVPKSNSSASQYRGASAS